ncbi:TadE/TadG family type IV pilus assembly protein [Erythrobacter sp. MTPC3]|uniref:TadE/TadG family type IV pilus assembly protein n=1 Tax=Erythrobacter sp. MTPC3 TaxID=3056564 RepID=UPI0036F2D694
MMKSRIKKFLADISGSIAIETAIVAPVLMIMTLGTFEVGTIVARQHELQSAANEAEIIILATNRGATVEISEIKEIIRSSVDLTSEQVTVEREFRCNQSNGKTKNKGNCPTTATISEYLTVRVKDRYTPVWTSFGVGSTINFAVNRTVQIS